MSSNTVVFSLDCNKSSKSIFVPSNLYNINLFSYFFVFPFSLILIIHLIRPLSVHIIITPVVITVKECFLMLFFLLLMPQRLFVQSLLYPCFYSLTFLPLPKINLLPDYSSCLISSSSSSSSISSSLSSNLEFLDALAQNGP